MPICLGRLLPTSRSLRHSKLHSELLLIPRLRLRHAGAVSTAGPRCFSKCSTALGRDFKRRPKEIISKEAESSNALQAPSPSPVGTFDPAEWIDALEPFLSPHLRTSSNTGDRSSLNAKEKSTAVTHIIAEARENEAGVEPLAELGLKIGRWAAVQSVVEILIADATSHIRIDSLDELPSNLDWPTSTNLENMSMKPIEVDRITSFSNESSTRWDELHFDPCYTDETVAEKRIAVEQIWMSLGSFILEAADLPSHRFQEVMKNVYQIIARLHNSGLVPEHVYSYIHTSFDSAVRRPPIMHLLSSRLLTTLSDAVWRAHSDEVIAQAASTGTTYRDLGHDPPGGRFRLKVRELGPEVWLEFILWCCVDGGFAKAGSWIVERMRTLQTEAPWFAVQWMSGPDGETSGGAMIDWASVKLRHGGTVGQIEGYNREKPFVEMRSRTVSVEVILALVEASLNGTYADNAGRGCTQESVLSSITKLLTFLEPHSLSDKYFDYLTVRLLQSSMFDFGKDPTVLQSLVDRLSYMRSLETTHKPAEDLPSLEVNSVLRHSEVYAGVLHQTLESLAAVGRVRPTLEMFRKIQELVDQSKLRSIGSFLHNNRRPDQSFFSARDFAFSQEYTSSHGQLPAPKLAALLDLLTEAGMTELGQWLVYSTDVDGPLIPLSLYSRSSLTPSLLRFAASIQDHMLMQDVVDTVTERPRKPPVSYLRSFADAQLQLKDFESAGQVLAALNEAKGGGNSLGNIASIVATMIKIESSAVHAWRERRARYLSPGMSLLEWLLEGDFRGIPGDFRKDQIQDYRRGLACLLRVVEAIPGTVLSNAARSWLPTLGESNVVGLDPRVFAIVLSAVVETRGARVGMMLWDLFCEEPAQEGEKHHGWVNADDIKLVHTSDGLKFQSNQSPLPGSGISTLQHMLPIRVEMSKKSTVAAADDDMNMDGTGEIAIFGDGYGLDTSEKESNGGAAIGNADAQKTEADFDKSPSTTVWLDGGDEAEYSRSFRNRSAVPGEHHPILPQNPPSADVSMSYAGFKDMLSGSFDPGSTEDDIVPRESGPYRPSPVVRPTFRTLRIIIRGALQELEAAKSLWYIEDVECPSLNISDVPAKANMRALEAAMTNIELVEQWAKPLFRKFGLSDKDVAVEFGWKLGEKHDNIFSTDALKKKYAAAKTEYQLAKMGMLADISEVDIQKRFFGPPIRKTEGKVHAYTKRELAFYFKAKDTDTADEDSD